MTYSLWFPTHGVESGLGGWIHRLFHQPAYKLDHARRELAAQAIIERCLERGWRLVSVDPGEREIVAVVESNAKPERVIHDFKIAVSLALASFDGDGPDRKRFDRRARIRCLSNSHSLTA